MSKASAPDRHVYAIALGSNRALAHTLLPRAILQAALIRLAKPPFRLVAASPILDSRPIGPSRRRYANSAALVESALPPLAMLAALQEVEHAFGRRRARRWGARTLDLDIILWSGGRVANRRLRVPHPAWSQRLFVVHPLKLIAPQWRDPLTGASITAICASLIRSKPVDRFPPPL